MAAGLGFKDFTTGEVLTAADVDGYLMQGIWVFASAAARDAAVTSPQEGNFAFLKDTNTTTYYTGSAWTNLDTTGMVNPMTTTGDTIYSSSGSTPARLGIGTAGQVLTVNAGATAPEWATPASGAATYAGCSLYDTSNQAVSNNTYTALTWNSENFDTDAYHSTSSNTSRITIPAGKGGKYLFNLKTQFIDQNTGGRNIALYKNGALVMESEFSLSTRGQLNLALQTVQNAVATDYYEFFVKHTQGTTESFIKTQTVAEFSASLLGA